MSKETTISLWSDITLKKWYGETEEEPENTLPSFVLGDFRLLHVMRELKHQIATIPTKKLGSGFGYLYNTDLESYFLRDLAFQFAQRAATTIRANAELEQEFHRLAEKWRNETAHLSSITKQVMNFNYQRIIGLGPDVLPILFRELERRPDYWFWALRAIVGEDEDPTRPEDAGNIERMTESWLEWARHKGYLHVSQTRTSVWQSAEQQI